MISVRRIWRGSSFTGGATCPGEKARPTGRVKWVSRLSSSLVLYTCPPEASWITLTTIMATAMNRYIQSVPMAMR